MLDILQRLNKKTGLGNQSIVASITDNLAVFTVSFISFAESEDGRNSI